MIIITTPTLTRRNDEQDIFLLLACDGFWDVMDAQEAVDRALEFLGRCVWLSVDGWH